MTRRSDRLKGKTRRKYTEPETSDSSTCDVSDSDDGFTDEDDDVDEDEILPVEIVMLLKDAINEALEEKHGTKTTPSPLNKNFKKRKRPDNSKLESPPIVPVDLDSMIALCRLCTKKSFRDCFNLSKLLGPLEELSHMVGLTHLKHSIVDYIIIHLQSDSIKLPDMRHLIIAGPPGSGKTSVSRIIAKILSGLNICETDRIVYGTQGNMIGSFLGQTAPKTEELIRSAFGGVLVIDEASSLADGRSDQNSDSFSKSCIDTLNRMLSEHGDKFICILAGYKKEIYRDILSINPGMDRRFSTRFEIEPYTPDEIREIIIRQILSRGGKLVHDTTIDLDWIKKNFNVFKNMGGDCLILVDSIMMSHAKRTFGSLEKNSITQEDVETGMGRFLRNIKERVPKLPDYLLNMYT